MKKVYLTETIHDDAVAYLKQHFEVIQGSSRRSEDIIRMAQDCEGILVRSASITKEMMEQMPKLRVIAKHGIGVDNIQVGAAKEKGILVVNAPFSNINAVAEHTVALLLAIAKNLNFMDRMTRCGDFARRTAYVNTEIAGKSVGLVGLGKISRLVAKKLNCMDVKILAYDPFVEKEDARKLEIELVSLDELLRNSDFVSLHTPLMKETEKMADKNFFKKMKNTAYFINVSRGPVTDEEALIDALQKKEIAGAALDVFDPEPPNENNPLFQMEQVIVSPHNAALTDRALLAMAMDSAEGICDYLEGRTPKYPVNA